MRPTASRAQGQGHADADLGADIEDELRHLGADLVGFAPIERWVEHGEVPEGYRPQDVWPPTRTVISFGIPVLLPVVETTPSLNYKELYDLANRLLDEISYKLSVWLVKRGCPAMSLPRGGSGKMEVPIGKGISAFSHVYAAKYAGLGSVGTSHVLLTPQWGPRVRLNSVLTAARIEPSTEVKGTLCNNCGLCTKLCPVGAITPRSDRILGDLDKTACTSHHLSLEAESGSPCGACIKVCPVGEDRKVYRDACTGLYRQERKALEKNPDDPRFRHLAHFRRHGAKHGRLF
jgi:epoxyqueuosine reductase QueG